MAAWPVQPGIEKGTVWISTFVKNGGELPDSILIFPYVNPSYEVQKILQPNTGEVVSLKDLGGGLGIIDLATNSNQKLDNKNHLTVASSSSLSTESSNIAACSMILFYSLI